MKGYIALKTILDYVLSFAMLIVLLPLLLLVSALVKCTSPGPVFFCHTRLGKDKRPFKIYKFRTMRTDTPKDMPTHLLADADQFITPIGHFLRKFSLDELPQLLNILRGEMSLIGPRPALWNQYDLLGLRDQNGANGLRPGLTGWAQVNGRDELPLEVKAAYDGYYAAHVSLWLDFKILLMTVGSVLTAKGVYEGAYFGESEAEASLKKATLEKESKKSKEPLER